MNKGLVITGIAFGFFAAGCGAVAANAPSPTLRPPTPTSIPGTEATPYPTDPPATAAPTAAPPTAKPAALYAVACTAIKQGNQGNWSSSQTHWLDAEEQASTAGDGTGTSDYYLMVTDSGDIALDHLDGASKATINANIATYHSDLDQVNADGYGC